ncbi:MAG: UDP-N-acetylmuramoyl-L-alanine--D-glutamate ligase, partial [Anaerolineae bacterium]
RRPADELAAARATLGDVPVEWATGGHPLALLDGVDLVCPSGGVPLDLPLIVEARRRGIPLSNDSQIFLEETPCQVIGITGSAGKTTTTTLTGSIAQTACGMENAPYRRAWVGGNIGNPLLNDVDAMHPGDLAVMELSSFQLEVMTRSPQVAVVLNITPNHLDRHGTMEAYTAAKANILRAQRAADLAVLGREDPGAWGLRSLVRGELLTFGWARPPRRQRGSFLQDGWVALWDGERAEKVLSREEIHLRGEHNLLNVLAACAAAQAVGLPPEAMRAGVAAVRGVPHRLEFVREWGGARWYNDSIATAPERTMAAIRSFDEPLVLLLGGRDKNLPWEALARLVTCRVDHLILFGEAADRIERAVRAAGPAERPFSLDVCPNLRQAVEAAARRVEPGDVVLLSPGGTSFDEFRDFAERGERFCQWVQALN